MKVLMYSNRKEDGTYWDASTPEKLDAALKCLFLHLKDGWKVYNFDMSREEKELADLLALEKDFKAGKVPEILQRDVERSLKHLPYLKADVEDTKWHKELYDMAVAGDDKAIRTLLQERNGGEYETWELLHVIDPLEELNGQAGTV